MAGWLSRIWRLGPGNPIVARLIEGGSRRPRHMYIRTGYLAVLIAVLLWSLLAGAGAPSHRELAAAGASTFERVAYLQIGLICLLAPVFMAGAIAQEASPRTWDVLLTTPLTPGQIVLGNLLGRLFFVAALVFGSLPLFAITQYFGGVPGRSVLVSGAIAVTAALLVGALAIALSVSRIVGKRAVFLFYIAVVSYLAITYALDALLRRTTGGVTPLTAINPFLALEALINPIVYPVPDAARLAAMGGMRRFLLGSPVLAWCTISVALSAAVLVAATLTVRAGGLFQSDEGASFFARLLTRRSADDGARAPRHVWQNPIAWAEASARAGGTPKAMLRAAFLGLGVLWAVGLIAAFYGGAMALDTYRFALMATLWTELGVATLIVVNLSATAVSREREDGTLDLLLTTPITAKAYISGKLRGLIAFAAPLIAVPIITIALAAGAAGVLNPPDGVGQVIAPPSEPPSALSSGRMAAPPQPPGRLSANTPQSPPTAPPAPAPAAPAAPAGVSVPVVLPEAAVLAPLAIIPFTAFAIMVGLQWSVRSKGTIGATVAAFGIVAVLTSVLGFCGWQMGQSVQVLGASAAALNPATLMLALVDPAEGAAQTVSRAGLGAARVSIAAGAALSALLWCGVVYAMHASMVRRFDMTVRQLAGVK